MVLQLLPAQIQNILQFRKRLAGPNDPSLEGLKSVSRLSLSLVTWPGSAVLVWVESSADAATWDNLWREEKLSLFVGYTHLHLPHEI